MAMLTIGRLAREAGVPTATIRYYERRGLLPRTARARNGYRVYSERAAQEVRFIKRAQAIGFSLDEILELLRLSRSGVKPCSRVIELATAQRRSIQARIRELTELDRDLAAAIERWSASCGFTADGLCELLDARASSRRAFGRPTGG